MLAYWRAIWRLLLVVAWLIVGVLLVFLLIRVEGASAYSRRQSRIIRWWMRRLLRVMGLRLVHNLISSAPVWVANHVSWCDIVVLMAISPSRFLSKAEVAHWPVIGWLARRVGTVFMVRGGHQTQTVLTYLAQVLASGGRVVFFPEGTSQGGVPQRFYPRLFALPIDAQTSVSPITLIYHDAHGRIRPDISYAGDQSFFQNLWYLLQQQGIAVEVIFSPDIASQGLSRRDLADACQTEIADKWNRY